MPLGQRNYLIDRVDFSVYQGEVGGFRSMGGDGHRPRAADLGNILAVIRVDYPWQSAGSQRSGYLHGLGAGIRNEFPGKNRRHARHFFDWLVFDHIVLAGDDLEFHLVASHSRRNPGSGGLGIVYRWRPG